MTLLWIAALGLLSKSLFILSLCLDCLIMTSEYSLIHCLLMQYMTTIHYVSSYKIGQHLEKPVFWYKPSTHVQLDCVHAQGGHVNFIIFFNQHRGTCLGDYNCFDSPLNHLDAQAHLSIHKWWVPENRVFCRRSYINIRCVTECAFHQHSDTIFVWETVSYDNANGKPLKTFD